MFASNIKLKKKIPYLPNLFLTLFYPERRPYSVDAYGGAANIPQAVPARGPPAGRLRDRARQGTLRSHRGLQ